MPMNADSPNVLLPTLPDPAPVSEAVLFAFDRWAFPFQQYVQVHLSPGQRPSMVLPHGPEGSHDEVLLFYGTVIRVGRTFHMWYNGNHGPLLNEVGYERRNFCICYATSPDGIAWEKPELGLVEFNGSKKNNIVALPGRMPFSTWAVLHDAEDPDPGRRFKAAYGVRGEGGDGFCVAFSPDGLRWNPLPHPVGPVLDMAGITKHRGLYYINGQTSGRIRMPVVRRLVTFVSADFERWSPLGAIGLDRAPLPDAPPAEALASQFEEVHLGAALWNRGNVILGIYGQWHGHASGDRRLVVIDLGLAISHDAVHYHEPIPGFRLVPAREQPQTQPGVAPALMQGQGMENVGERTLLWYSTWRGTQGSGVRMVCWDRDRLGMLKPFGPPGARAISCPIRITHGTARLFANVSLLSPHCRLRVGLLEEGFAPIPGRSGDDAATISEGGLRVPVRWKAGDGLLPSHGRFRLDVHFDGIRAEDCCLHALYVGA